MGAVNSACLKPRAADAGNVPAAATPADALPTLNGDVVKLEVRPAVIVDPTTAASKQLTSDATREKTTTPTMENGDASTGKAAADVGVDEKKTKKEKVTKRNKEKKKRKRSELSHAFQLTAFQSRENVIVDGSKDASSLASSDG